MVNWIVEAWGITPSKSDLKGSHLIVFGDDETNALCGYARNKRTAKKQITHYINRGLSTGSFHGAYKQLRLINIGMNNEI